MLRFALRRTPSAALAATSSKAFYCAAPEKSVDPKSLSRDKLEIAVRNKMKQYWNDGNLFALSAGSLEKYLEMEGVKFREKSAKAVLVRLCEDTLQYHEAKAAGLIGQEGKAGDTKEHGEWDKPVASSKSKFLDVAQRDFYRSAVEYAPRAFQVMPEATGSDLHVARVNTTAFPGFPSSSECYTLTPADAADSNRIRYTKTLLWGITNLRNLKAEGELTVDLGKFLLSDNIFSKPNEAVIPYWDAQQRMHAKKPHFWVSAASAGAAGDVEKYLQEKGFTAGAGESSFDVVIKRAKDSVHAKLDAKGAVTKVSKVRAPLQATHILREEGPDMRICLRNQASIGETHTEEVTKALTADAAAKKFSVAPEAGEVTYSAANVEKSWTLSFQEGLVSLKVIQRQRSPMTTPFFDLRVEIFNSDGIVSARLVVVSIFLARKEGR